MPEIKLPVSFHQLIQDCQRVEVPLIQRDYAQGRESEEDLRNDFLGALHGALSLPAGDSKLPLNLDFVYGSMEARDSSRFLPLDGQQRLTTLFLLHWYLAWRDGRLSDFKAMLWDDGHSRFTYRVRPSSTEFFDELVKFVPAGSADDVSSVKEMLEDQPWFFLSWRLDPTIQGVLTMLDSIHGRFQTSAGLYARLVDEREPAITFHLLPLEHFGLSDDLYIKMNARGKPLTAFETFKARFEELLKELFPSDTRQLGETELPVPVFFERRMDTQWTDFFWSHQGTTFDGAAMNLVWALIRVSLDPASREFAADTRELADKSLRVGFTLFHDRGWLTTRFTDNVMDLLEAWSAGGGRLTPQLPGTNHFDEAAFLRKATDVPSALTYLELVQFAAFVFYLTHFRGTVQKDALQEWMRVVTNLAANSDIERPEEFGRSLAGLHQLVPHGDRILERFAEPEIEVPGFSPQQVREEALKASLILSRAGWRERIDAAEAHGYFQGQIEFLLKFSGVLDRWLDDNSVGWSDTEDAEYQRKFSEYFAKASAVFSATGLNDFGAYRWERALLTKGDYLLPRGINRSFLDNQKGDGSWKRLLRGSFKSDQPAERKRQYVRELFDEIDVGKGIKESLDAVLAMPLSAEPWRRAAVEQPEILRYCSRRNIRLHQDGNFYLMRRLQMNGEHAELFTYHLHVGLLSKKHGRGELAPFGAPRYESVIGETEDPRAYLRWAHGGGAIVLDVVHENGVFLLDVWKDDGALPDEVRDALVCYAGFEAGFNGAVYRKVERAAIETALDEIVNVARRLHQPPVDRITGPEPRIAALPGSTDA